MASRFFRRAFRIALLGTCAPANAWGLAQDAPSATDLAPAKTEMQDLLGGLKITLFGNVLGRRDDVGMVDSDGNQLDDRVYLRSLGIGLTAPLGDFGRGVVLGRWSEGADGEFETEFDDAYVEVAPIPLPWDAVSQRFSVRLGRFRAPFGRSNRWHVHELPQITRPLPVRRLLGEDGLVQTGLALEVDVPMPSESLEFRFTTELDRDNPLDESFTPLFNFDARWNLTDRDAVDFGVSTDSSRRERDYGFQSSLVGADVLFSHRPKDENSAGTILLGGEYLTSEVSRPDGTDEPEGAYAWLQFEFLPDWYAGLRFDTAEEIEDASLETNVTGAYLGWAAHPQLRFALGYERTNSDVPSLDGADTLLVEVNFVFGSPAASPFWLDH